MKNIKQMTVYLKFGFFLSQNRPFRRCYVGSFFRIVLNNTFLKNFFNVIIHFSLIINFDNFTLDHVLTEIKFKKNISR